MSENETVDEKRAEILELYSMMTPQEQAQFRRHIIWMLWRNHHKLQANVFTLCLAAFENVMFKIYLIRNHIKLNT